MKKNSKRNVALLISGTAVLAGMIAFDTFYQPEGELHRPELKQEEDGGHDISKMGRKLIDWSAEDAAAYEQLLANKAGVRGSRAAIDAKGRWINRGPANMPGAWNIATIDVGTDTIYAVTCGHYGGLQTIWKGTVPTAANPTGGDNFQMLPGTGRAPTRIRDIDVFHTGGTKVICYAVENGGFFYSHDDGMNFTKATGLPAVLQASAVDRKTGTIYATDGADLFTSSNKGVSFTKLLNLGTKAPTRLRTPLYPTQAGYGTMFVQHGKAFKMITGSTARTMGNVPGNVEDENFHVEGDARRFYVSSKNSAQSGNPLSQSWWTTADTGKTWTTKTPTAHYYDGVCELTPYEGFGVGILNPLHVTGGYAHPSVSNDGLTTTYENMKQWGWYQGNQGAVATQQATLKKYYHPDFQSTAFFLDKEGKEFSLWMSDGGLFINRTVHLNPADMNDAEKYGFQNIMLGGGSAVTEVYEWGMVSGNKGATDFALGTQDQGVQTSQPNLLGEMVQVIQSPGGDGDPAASGPDGEYGWQVSGSGVKRPFALYSGTTFLGSKNMQGTKLDIAVRNIWHDLKDYTNTIWVLNGELNKVVWNGSSFSTSTKTFGNAGNVAALCQSPSNKSLFWVLDNNKVYKSTDGGANFGAGISVPMSASSNKNDVRGWAFDDNTILFAGKSNNTVTSILSTDGGATWASVPGLVNADVRWMQGDKNKTVAMASTKVGPYLFDLATKTWVDAAGDIQTGAPFFDGMWGSYNPNTNTFRFSSWGFGVWDFEVNDNAPKLTTSATIPATIKRGETITVNWVTNQTGTVTVDIMKGSQKVATLGTAAHTAKTFSWKVDNSVDYGTNYSLRVTLGSVTSSTTTFTIMPELFLIDAPSNLSIVSFSSEEIVSEPTGIANLLDDKQATFWDSKWSSGSFVYPHYFVVKLKTLTTLRAFSIMARQDESTNGEIKGYKIEVSTDGTTWTNEVSGDLPAGKQLNTILFNKEQKVQFVRFTATSPQTEGQAWASAAEFDLYGVEPTVGTNALAATRVSTVPVALVNGTVILNLTRADNVRVQVFSLNGRVVAQSTLSLSEGNHSIPLNFREIGAGNYLVRVSTSSAGVLNKKMIVQ